MLKKISAKGLRYSFVIAMSVLATTGVSAESKTITLKVIEGYESSEAVLSGKYQEAVMLAKEGLDSGSYYDRAVNATSLCVAYAKLADVDSAVDACKQAVSVSRRAADRDSLIYSAARNNRKVVDTYSTSSELSY